MWCFFVDVLSLGDFMRFGLVALCSALTVGLRCVSVGCGFVLVTVWFVAGGVGVFEFVSGCVCAWWLFGFCLAVVRWLFGFGGLACWLESLGVCVWLYWCGRCVVVL